jgi:hypothetical protein
MRGGRLAFDAADQRYSNSRLSQIVAARWQEADDRVFVAQAQIGQANPQEVGGVVVAEARLLIRWLRVFRRCDPLVDLV